MFYGGFPVKKLVFFLITGLVGISLQAVKPGQLIPFKTSDNQITLLTREVAQQSGTLADLLQDESRPDQALAIQGNITKVEFKRITSLLELLAESKIDEQTVNKLKEKYNSFQFNDKQHFRFAEIVNYLDIVKLQQILPIPVQINNDDKIFWIEPSIIAQSTVLTNNCQDCADNNEPICLPNINAKSFKLTLEALKRKSFEDFSPDEKANLYISSDYLGIDSIKFIDIDFFLGKQFSSNSFGFSPGSKILTVGYQDDTAELIDLSDQSVLKTFANINSFDFSFSPDNKLLTVRYKDDTGELVDLFDQSVLKTFTNVFDFSFSPDNKLLTVLYNNNTGELIDLSDQSVLKTFTNVFDFSNSFRFSPDNKLLTVGYKDATSELIDLSDLSVLKAFANVNISYCRFSRVIVSSPVSNRLRVSTRG